MSPHSAEMMDLFGYLFASFLLGCIMIGAGMSQVRTPRLKRHRKSYWPRLSG